jgi:hypothetical protein
MAVLAVAAALHMHFAKVADQTGDSNEISD